MKTLVQVNVFHIYDLVDSMQFLLTKAVRELTTLLWFPEICDLEEYLVSQFIRTFKTFTVHEIDSQMWRWQLPTSSMLQLLLTLQKSSQRSSITYLVTFEKILFNSVSLWVLVQRSANISM